MNQKMILWVIVALVVVGFAWLVLKPAGVEQKDIGNEDLLKLQAAGARIVDVRTVSEYEAGHIKGAENVPVDRIQQAAAGWDRTIPVVVYCATGARSLNAKGYLAGQGFEKVYNLKAGAAAWNGELVTGQDSGQAGTTPPPAQGATGAKVQTAGKPMLIDFSSST